MWDCCNYNTPLKTKSGVCAVFLVLVTCGILMYQRSVPIYNTDSTAIPCWLSGQCYNTDGNGIQASLREHMTPYINDSSPSALVNNLVEKVESLEKTVGDMLEEKEEKEIKPDLKSLKKEINIDLDKSLKTLRTNVSASHVLMERLQQQIQAMENKLNESIYNQEIESMSDTGKTAESVQVLLLTYMRSGSTFVGELFKQNPDVTYWFEPLDGVYRNLYFTEATGVFPVDISHYANGTRRQIPEFEHEALADNLLALLSCDYNNVATETMYHYRGLDDIKGWETPGYSKCLRDALDAAHMPASTPFKALGNCQAKLKHNCKIDKYESCHRFKEAFEADDFDGLKTFAKTAGIGHIAEMAQRLDCISSLHDIYPQCSSIVRDKCSAACATAAKVIRLSMETVVYMLKKNPNLKIIHLLRDPRGIAHSRSKIGLMSRLSRHNEVSKMVTEAGLICQKMESDLEVRKNLEQVHSSNFLEVRYEDVAADQEVNYKRIYDFLNLEPSSLVEKWISSSVSGHGINLEGAFGTFRKNSTETAYKWKEDVNENTMESLNSVCNTMLKYLGAL